jgi:hypothetical protein
MENLKIKQLQNKLEEQWFFFDKDKIKNGYSEEAILNWITDTVVLLNEIGVNELIIKNLMEKFEINYFQKKINLYGYDTDIIECRKFGPFVSEKCAGIWGKYKYFDSGKIFYINIAYRSARTILKRGLEEERIIPRWLINELESKGKYKNIVSSLELIETKYENKDPIDLTKNVIILLENIIDLEPLLKDSGKQIGGKLNTLVENKDILNKFGANDDIVRALSNSRVIRNVYTHKEAEIKYDIPFLVACSFAYLAIIFLEITISTGELIN